MDEGGQNEVGTTSYKCSICGGDGPFSNRQRKKAMMGEPARCVDCIQNQQQAHDEEQQDPEFDNDDDEKDVEEKKQPGDEKEVVGEVSNRNIDQNNEEETTKEEVEKADDGKCYFSDGQSASIHDDDDDNNDNNSASSRNSSSSSPAHVDVSVKAIKDRIMGRKLQSSDVNDPLPNAASTLEELQSDVTCVICHDIFYDPITLTCGHSFCKDCLSWWLTEHPIVNYGKCVTCNRQLPSHHTSFQVNTSLRACVLAVFGDEVQARRTERLKTTKGENDGAHERGSQILTPLDDELWKKIPGNLAVRRSIVLDADDQRMQWALAIYRTHPVIAGDSSIVIQLCSLHLEEEEAADGCVPILLFEEDDEHMIEREDDQTVTVTAKLMDGSERSIESKDMSDGTVEFHIGSLSLRNAAELRFYHTGVKTELSIRLVRVVGEPETPVGLRNGEAEKTRGGDSHRRGGGRSFFYEEEAEHEGAEGENEYEDDGFLVGDEEEVMEEDDNDECCVCHEVGELMICDGGDRVAGCGRGFHFGCVGRDKVPAGDWICRRCAKADFDDVGREGFEFPEEGIDLSSSPDEKKATAGEDRRKRSAEELHHQSTQESTDAIIKDDDKSSEGDDNDEDGDDESPMLNQRAKKQKSRTVIAIDDSDDD